MKEKLTLKERKAHKKAVLTLLSCTFGMFLFMFLITNFPKVVLATVGIACVGAILFMCYMALYDNFKGDD